MEVKATWYKAGYITANGERFDTSALTAAHKTLAFGTWVTLRNPSNNHSVKVRINDRVPKTTNTDYDLTPAAFKTLGHLDQGILFLEQSF